MIGINPPPEGDAPPPPNDLRLEPGKVIRLAPGESIEYAQTDKIRILSLLKQKHIEYVQNSMLDDDISVGTAIDGIYREIIKAIEDME